MSDVHVKDEKCYETQSSVLYFFLCDFIFKTKRMFVFLFFFLVFFAFVCVWSVEEFEKLALSWSEIVFCEPKKSNKLIAKASC